MPRHRNPFLIGRLATGAALANRRAELARLQKALTDVDRRLVYYGDRRMGKSSALEEAALRARKAGHVVAIADLNTAAGSDDAARRILDAVYRQIGEPWREALERIAGRLKATITWQPTPEGLPSFSLGLERADAARSPAFLPDTLDAIDAELRRRKLTIGLGIDEFQRLFAWGGDDAGWALKHAIERHERIAYVLTGSSRRVIAEFLKDSTRGLWKAVEALEFGPIDRDELVAWIRSRARSTGVAIDHAVAALIVDATGPRTRDIVQLARSVWDLAAAGRPASADAIATAFDTIAHEQAPLYLRIWQPLSRPQQRVLALIAGRPDASLTARDTLREFDLGPKSTVGSAADQLAQMEMLQRVDSGGYRFDDPYFRRWVQLNATPDLGIEPPPALEGAP